MNPFANLFWAVVSTVTFSAAFVGGCKQEPSSPVMQPQVQLTTEQLQELRSPPVEQAMQSLDAGTGAQARAEVVADPDPVGSDEIDPGSDDIHGS